VRDGLGRKKLRELGATRQAVVARVPRRAQLVVRIRPQVRPGALHPRARRARQDAADRVGLSSAAGSQCGCRPTSGPHGSGPWQVCPSRCFQRASEPSSCGGIDSVQPQATALMPRSAAYWRSSSKSRSLGVSSCGELYFDRIARQALVCSANARIVWCPSRSTRTEGRRSVRLTC
jgi:hypothetical protein